MVSTPFQLRGVLPPPRSQGKLLWVHAATSGRRLSCARVPQRRSLSAANLHPSLLCELLGSEVAAASLTFFCAAALLDFQDWQTAVQRSHSLSRLRRSSFQVKRGVQRVQDQRHRGQCWSKAVSQRRSWSCLSAQTRSIHLKKSGGRALALHCSASTHLPALCGTLQA